MGSGHGHGHGGGGSRPLGVALALNSALAAAQVVGGLAFGSLALLADAAHQVVDVVALATVLVAQVLARRPPSTRRTFGWQRADLLAAQASAVLLLVSSAWIVVEAVRRLGDGGEIDGPGVVVLALAGLAVNGGSAFALVRGRDRTLGVRSAIVHLVSDAAGSAGVLVAGLAVTLADATWVDPVVSIGIAVLVTLSAVRLLRQASHLLLEGTPPGLDPAEIDAALRGEPGVVAVHHLHLWAIASDQPALSAHVVLRDGLTLHQAQEHGDALKGLLHDRYGIEHSTLELECHPCDEPDHRTAGRDPTG
ncbi:MAG: cation transporter [Acidimicrobiales bacterium]|nr:cation transporter [Acidimicrobiales bacterium]